MLKDAFGITHKNLPLYVKNEITIRLVIWGHLGVLVEINNMKLLKKGEVKARTKNVT